MVTRKVRPAPHATHEQLLLLCLGDLPLEEAEGVRSHLSQCAICQHEFEKAQQFESLMQKVPFDEPSPEKWESIRQSVLENFRDSNPRRYPEALVGLIESVRHLWMWALEDPMIAVSYLAIALAYVSYNLLGSTPVQSLLPQLGQIMQLLRLAL